MYEIHLILMVIGGLLLLSIFLSRFSSRIGIPSLIIFLFIGLLFDASNILPPNLHNFQLVQYLSTFALIIIMFSGGMNTDYKVIKPIAKQGISLATVGVVITAFTIGILIHLIFNFDLMLCLLLSAIISSTDGAAVFSIFGASDIKIKHNLDHILELESATNDPVAYILVSSIMFMLITPTVSTIDFIVIFIKSIILGGIGGYILGRLFAWILKHIRLSVEGLYPPLLFAMAILSFSIVEAIGGNGFLSVFICALIVGNSEIKHKENQLSFFDGLSWLMQILMFLLLGVFTAPNELLPMIVPAIAVSIILTFVARPLAVFVSLLPFRMGFKPKLFLAWSGIKGAVPIVFAFYPLVAGIPEATMIFNIVMIITFISVIIHGTSIKFVAKHLGLLE
ncbi:MAG: potassium/proton antiporter [Methanobrevibacter sp.]|uniref:potassium/proton antiporter n=1 Tax=Methanobrevibacter sp. TaxID=66852 RepID=UPI0025D85A20|nr:potassium/proton antiporter [Methanobrevibacter sp.]MBR0272315.1 potassium/proton antiporter [Methanobrevibacter sp.]